MNINVDLNLVMLILSTIIILVLFFYIRRRTIKNSITNIFFTTIVLMLIWIVPLIYQILYMHKFDDVNPILFDYVAYVGICFLPVSIFFVSQIFINTKVKLKKFRILFIIPMISLILLWTNDSHHLFYKEYSTNINDAVLGSYMNVHIIYTYGLLLFSIFNLLKYTIKNAGFFSKQSILIVIGTLIPIVVNIFGTFNIIPMTIYITPICFAFTILCYAIAIFRFKFLSIAPIAMQKIVDRISDSFIVLNENYIITDFNETFLHTFSFNPNDIREKSFFKLFDKNNHFKLNTPLFQENLKKIQHSNKTIEFELPINAISKIFSVEMSNIFSKNSLLGILILFKDITQHKNDILTIQNNQNMLIEQERLASLRPNGWGYCT